MCVSRKYKAVFVWYLQKSTFLLDSRLRMRDIQTVIIATFAAFCAGKMASVGVKRQILAN